MDILGQRFYPLGIQTFSELREGNFLYIDKTEYVYRMTHPYKYVFLSRPRRFGKSLLTSTLHSYFEGRKDLFKGLAIEKLETEWAEYPVLHFSMASAKHLDKDALTRFLINQLDEYGDIYGVSEKYVDTNIYLANLIKCAYKKTRKKVVVLVDEYDSPLLDVIHEDEDLPVLRNIMRNFYSPLKDCDPYLRFVFITGITKFSQLSIFSELNNIENVSMDAEYAAICGITEEEMKTQMGTDIKLLAERLGKTPEETFNQLKANYDGYHFTSPSPDIYNPYSLMNAMKKGKIDAYWFATGTPTYLIDMMRKFNVNPDMIGERKAKAPDFDAPTEQMTNITPLLYQSGYLTIKDYSNRLDRYTLDIPNKEVRVGLMESLLPNYVASDNVMKTRNMITDMYDAIDNGDMDGALRLLQTFLSTVPYCDNTDYEGHYQQMMYVIFSLLGYYVDVEVRTSKGRVDMVMRTDTRLYLVELKLNSSSDVAMRQIDLKDYSERFALSGLPVVKVGINFDGERHTLADWKIE